jgi:hypothetical protein
MTPDQLPSLFSDLWYDTKVLDVELEGTEEIKHQTAQALSKAKIELLTACFIC